jgi:hypothetical protein
LRACTTVVLLVGLVVRQPQLAAFHPSGREVKSMKGDGRNQENTESFSTVRGVCWPSFLLVSCCFLQNALLYLTQQDAGHDTRHRPEPRAASPEPLRSHTRKIVSRIANALTMVSMTKVTAMSATLFSSVRAKGSR